MFGRMIAIMMATCAMLCAGSADASEFRVLIDKDMAIATGCTVATPNGNFAGVEEILTTTVNTTVYPGVITGVTRQSCVTAPGTFSAPATVDAGGWPVGLGVGTAGYDAIETYYPELPATGVWRLGFVYQDGAVGADALTANSSGLGLALTFGAQAIPTLGTVGVFLLSLMLGLAAYARLRKSRSGSMVWMSLLFVMVVAPVWAGIAMILDGQVGDWSDATLLAKELTPDAPPGADMAAVFLKFQSGRVYFRADVKTAAPPTASNDTYAVAAGSPLAVSAATSGLLKNDTLGGPPATATSFGGGNLGGTVTSNVFGTTATFGSGGSLSAGADGGFSYTPSAGFTGAFVFNYRISNVAGWSDGQATINVNQAPAITSAANASFTAGTAGTFTVNASGFPNGAAMALSAAGALPAGVAFTDNHNGSATLAGTPGAGSVNAYPLTITAHNGIGSDAAQTFTLTVGKAGSASAVTASVNPSVPGQAVTFTATVTTTAAAGVSPPTGTVTFLDGAVALASNVPLSGGTANFSTSALAQGAHSITVLYNGDGNLNTSTSAVLSQNVTKGNSTSSVVSMHNPTVAGQSVTFNATVAAASPATGTPTGTVNFFDGASPIASNVALVAGAASFSSSSLSAGTRNITVAYNGDANFNSSTSSILAQTVNPAATSTTLGAAPGASTFGQNVVFTAAIAVIAPGAGTPTGTVTFKDGATTIGTSAVVGGTSASLTFNGLSAGNHASISATYSGDANFASSGSANQAQTVTQAATATVLASNINPSLVAQDVTFSATLSASAPGAGTPTGTVNFYDNAVLIGSGALTSGVAQFSTAALGGGTHPITSTYAGDGNFVGSAGALSQVVNQAPTAVADTCTVAHDSIANAACAGLLVNDIVRGNPPVTELAGVSGSGPVCSAFPCTITSTHSALNGVVVQADGTFVYTPAALFAGTDSFDYNLNNGIGVSAATATITVTDALPVIDLNGAGAAGIDFGPALFTENGGAVAIVDNALLSVTDADSAELASAAIVIANVQNDGSENIGYTCPDGPAPACSGAIQSTDIVPSSASGTYTLTITRRASPADYQALLRTLTYNNSSANPTVAPDRDITVTVNDRIVDNDPIAHATVQIGAVNSAPTVTAPAAATTQFETDLAFAGNVSVADPDAGAGDVKVTLTSTNGITTLSSTAGFTTVTGNGTALVVATGPLSAQNAALNGMAFRPNSAFDGAATLKIDIDDLGNTGSGAPVPRTDTKTIAITVSPANLAPAAASQSVTINEDTSASITLGGSDVDSPTLTFAIAGGPSHGSLGAIGAPSCTPAGSGTNCTASVTYTPTAAYNGPDSFTFTTSDGTLTSLAGTVSITVTGVNDVPSFSKGADQTVLEDAGAQSVTNWATSISAGPADEAGQTVDFIVSNTNNSLFSVQPAVNAAGTLTYTPAPNQNGAATVSVQIHDNGGGTDTSAAQTFTITVSAVNDIPSFTKGADQTVVEDAGAQSVTNWATSISAGPANEAGQSVDFIVSNTNNSLFSVQPAVSAAGTLTFTSAANQNGVATVSVQIHDNGGTANGGVDTSAVQTFTITVTAVNDAPSFTKGADQTVLEDAGAQSVPNWAASISSGPADEAGQTVDFIVTNTNNGLFSVQPAVSAAGTLTYTPAANQNGAATVSVQIHDNGGAVDTSAVQTFTITVTAVNDLPSFTKGADQTVLEDAGAQSVANWATSISTGPANESGQTVDFVVSNDNNALFSTQPAVSAAGTLTYTPAPNKNGAATVSVQIHDNGGGTDTSVVQTITITVTAVNDAPVAQNKSGIAVQANMKRVGIDAGLLTGVTDADSGVNGCSPTFSVASITGVSGGTVSNVNLGSGTFDFDPEAGFTGTAVVNYTVSDDGCPGSTTSVAATISLTVNGPVIWFVDSGASGGGTGTLLAPFITLAEAVAVDEADHNIFLYAGTYGTAITLNTGEGLVGQGVSAVSDANFTSFDAVFGITPPAGTIARPTINGARPTVQGTVTLNTNSKVRGLNLSTGASTGMNDPVGAITGASVSEVAVTTTTGTGVNLSNIAGALSFTGLTTNGGTGASLTGSNASATFAFTGVSVSSFANTGFNATGGGTITVTGASNTLASTTGTALYVANTVIGASGLTFTSIAANGGANGIFLQNTGALGGLSVTGNGIISKGGNSSGGTIRNMAGGDGATAGNGIYLENTRSVSLKRMQLNGFQNSAIRGFNVTDFTLQYSTISGTSGDQSGATEGAVTFGTVSGTNGLAGGANLLDNNIISGAIEHNLEFYNHQAGSNYSLTISNSDVKSNSAGSGSDGIQIELGGAYANTATISIQAVSFDDNKSQGVQASALGSSNLDITINGSTLTRTSQGNEGFVLQNGANGRLTAHVTNNTLSGIDGTAIFVGQVAGNASPSSDLTAVIKGNTVTHGPSATNHGIIAFLTSTVGQVAPANILIETNNVTQNSTSGTARAILVDAPDANTSPSFTATVIGNTVSVGDNFGGVTPIVVQARQSSTGCFDIRNNTANFPSGTPAGMFGVRARQSAPAIANLEAGVSASSSAVTVLDENHAITTTTEVLGTVGVVNNNTCAPAPL